MKVLAIDTVFNRCAIAIVELPSNDSIDRQIDGQDDNFIDNLKVIYHLEQEGKREQTRQILPMIDEAFKTSGIKLSEISALIFNRGPGAFSGIRINTAVVQALSVGCDIPCIGISSLQLLAQAGHDRYQIAENEQAYSILDARMKQVYICQYICISGLMQPVNNASIDLGESLLDYGLKTDKDLPIFALASDDHDLLDAHNSQLLNQDIMPNAITLAKLGINQFKKTGGVSAEQALPVYIRNNTWKTLKEQGKQ